MARFIGACLLSRRLGLAGCLLLGQAACLLFGQAGCAACNTDAPRSAVELPPPPAAIPEAADWATRVGQSPLSKPSPDDVRDSEQRARQTPRADARAAVASDATEDSAELVDARRLVYRVSFIVPHALQDRNARVAPAAGELHIDASLQRLRARFVGPGWPVPEGVEIRLRPDVPGVYLFDASGGRSIGPGQLASWFEGRELGEPQSLVRVRREYGDRSHEPTPGHLVCMLLAEWARQPREALEHRCAGASPVPGFRFGPFSAELTAVVPLQLPRYALRADEIDAPAPLPAQSFGRMLDSFEHLPPLRAPKSPEPMADAASTERGALEVVNHTDTRAIVIVQGVPIGWLEAGVRATFEGFVPGLYRIGAIRPLGILRLSPKPISIPGTLLIGRPAKI